MRWKIDWGLPLLMFGCGVLGYVLATAQAQQRLSERLDQQTIAAEITKAKSHMTTILQLKDCHVNEAFYALDRQIFEAKKHIETLLQASTDAAQRKKNIGVIEEYYQRFGMSSACDDCVPRSPLPILRCASS